MKQIPIYFKSDFPAILASETQWGGVPFRLNFYTASPSRAFVASFDGETYENCRLLEDGRLEIAFNQKDGTVQTLMGIGKLMLAPEFYLDNDAFRDHICNQFVKPFSPVFIDEKGEEYNLVLGLEGAASIVAIGTLPAFYQKGDKGDPGLTPEEHDALVQATENANTAADRAEQAAQSANTAAENANEKAGLAEEATESANEATRMANEAREHVEQTDASASEAEALRNTREAARITNENARQEREAARITNENARQEREAARITNENARQEREAARVNNEATREQQETAREQRTNTAVSNANTATANANTAATQAGNVNAVLNGDNLTVTDKNGQSVTRNVRGPKGDSITMFPNVTIFGQPTIQESQISGFTAQNYVQFPFLVDFAGRPWQLDCSITTGADVSQQHNVFDSAFGLAFAFSGGKFVLAMSSNGTSWNLGATSGTHNIVANTTYYIRISWDGTRYVLAYSTDKETWVDDIVVTSSASLASKQIVIGKSLDNRYIFNGSINMADAHLTISGKIVWEGMDDAGLATRMAIDLSNIDDEGKARVNEVAMAGEVGQKLGDLSAKINNIHVWCPTSLGGYVRKNGDSLEWCRVSIFDENSNKRANLVYSSPYFDNPQSKSIKSGDVWYINKSDFGVGVGKNAVVGTCTEEEVHTETMLVLWKAGTSGSHTIIDDLLSRENVSHIDERTSSIESNMANKEDVIEHIEISQATRVSFIVRPDNKLGAGISIVIPIVGYDSVTIKAKESTLTCYQVMKDLIPMDTEDVSPYYATGYNSRVIVNAGRTDSVELPFDAKYLYVFYSIPTDIDRSPESLSLTKYGVKDIVASEYLLNRYNGKRLSILGDSISTWGDPDKYNQNGTFCYSNYPTDSCAYAAQNAAFILNSVNETYWMRLINKLGMVLGVNESWRATEVADNFSSNNWTKFNNQSRIDHLGLNGTPDVIMIYGGTNDILHGTPLGTFNTESPVEYTDEQIADLPATTFADAYRTMLIRVMKKYPNAEVICILPNFVTRNQSGVKYFEKVDGYNEIIKEACDYLGVKYIDARTSGITPFNTTQYFVDVIHPNAAGMKLLYERIYRAMLFD